MSTLSTIRAHSSLNDCRINVTRPQKRIRDAAAVFTWPRSHRHSCQRASVQYGVGSVQCIGTERARHTVNTDSVANIGSVVRSIIHAIALARGVTAVRAELRVRSRGHGLTAGTKDGRPLILGGSTSRCGTSTTRGREGCPPAAGIEVHGDHTETSICIAFEIDALILRFTRPVYTLSL
jgi:hypothetical protein